jgi:hypothetical protein
VLAKDKDENLTDKQRVHVLMKGIKSSDASIIAAKTSVFKDYRSDFNAATSFLSGLISNIHSSSMNFAFCSFMALSTWYILVHPALAACNIIQLCFVETLCLAIVGTHTTFITVLPVETATTILWQGLTPFAL